MAVKGGTRANRSGDRLEQFVAETLEDKDYLFVPRFRFFAARELEQPIYTRQCEIGKSVYGKKRKIDVVLHHPRLWPDCLGIQCKWQAGSGSAEEKYPHEILSIAQNSLETIIILDGGGYSAAARKWLVGQAGKDRLHAVLDQGEFTRFASRRL